MKVTFPEELKRGGPFSIPWWLLGVFAASKLKICGSIKKHFKFKFVDFRGIIKHVGED